MCDYKGIKVMSSDRVHKGVATGGTRRCHLEGCKGTRIAVRWSDGALTFPCTEGMRSINDKTLQIYNVSVVPKKTKG